MSYITMIGPDVAGGSLKELYKMVSGPDGQVDHVLQVHSLRPHTLSGHMALYKAVLHHRENMLPKWFLEAIGVFVSRLNGCQYCDRHHSEGLQKLLENSAQDFSAYDAALAEPTPGDPFDAAQQAVFVYVSRLTLTPGKIGRSDVSDLRAVGLSDGEILEINQVASYFAYANRTVSGLGVSINGEKLGMSPQSGDGEEAWRHD